MMFSISIRAAIPVPCHLRLRRHRPEIAQAIYVTAHFPSFSWDTENYMKCVRMCVCTRMFSPLARINKTSFSRRPGLGLLSSQSWWSDHHHHNIVMVRVVCIECVNTPTRGRFVDGLDFCFHTRTHTHPTKHTGECDQLWGNIFCCLNSASLLLTGSWIGVRSPQSRICGTFNRLAWILYDMKFV